MVPETNSGSKGWFRTLPQILTGAAAFLTALGAAVAAIVSFNIKWTTPPVTTTAPPVSPLVVTTPSFPCSKAATQVEHLICQNVTLATSDLKLNDDFNEISNHLSGSSRELLIREQAEWRRERDACENYNDKIGCVERAYQSRIAALRNYAQQPAAENSALLQSRRNAQLLCPKLRRQPLPSARCPGAFHVIRLGAWSRKLFAGIPS